MPVKTTISEKDYSQIISNYNFGKYKCFQLFAHGAGQTTVLIKTSKRKCVLRYYENRSEKHVFFEIKLFQYLLNKNFPVPAVFKNRFGKYLGKYKGKPYIVIEFVNGEHSRNPNKFFERKKFAEIIKTVAKLHKFTKSYQPSYFNNREEFNAKYCWRTYKNSLRKINIKSREIWLKKELARLEFPDFLPRGLCHADLNYGNFLFQRGKVAAVLDFDMSFYHFLVYDIANLLYWWAWPPHHNFKQKIAALIVKEYSKSRKLNLTEKKYIYDALKLIILLGICWSDESDFEQEKKKIDYLNSLSRENFYHKIFN
jgi:homoserine kinase type II